MEIRKKILQKLPVALLDILYRVIRKTYLNICDLATMMPTMTLYPAFGKSDLGPLFAELQNALTPYLVRLRSRQIGGCVCITLKYDSHIGIYL